MARQKPHTHPCKVCRVPVKCAGYWDMNVDGEPDVICSVIHRPDGRTLTVLCLDCAEKEQMAHG